MKEKGQGDVKMNDKLLSLKTERLVLHSFSDSDIDYALSIFYNDEIKKTYMLPDFPSRENAVALFERLERLSMNPARFVYGIYLDETLIGFINDVEIADQTIEVGYVKPWEKYDADKKGVIGVAQTDAQSEDGIKLNE